MRVGVRVGMIVGAESSSEERKILGRFNSGEKSERKRSALMAAMVSHIHRYIRSW